MKLLKIALAVAALSVSAAQAAHLPFTPYVLGSVGATKLKTDTTGAVSTDMRDTGYALGAGVMFNQYLAAELRYVDPGKFSAFDGTDTYTVRGSGGAFGVLGMLPVHEKISIFGRVDAVYLRAKSDDTTGASARDSGTYLGLGGGVQYSVAKDVAVRVHYDRIRKIEIDGDKGDVDTVGGTLLKSF